MELKRTLQKNLYAVGYSASGRYIMREKISENDIEKAIQSIFEKNTVINSVKLEEHYELA